MPNSLRDKIIVITGAGGGIGSAAARYCAEEGATVVLTDLPATPMADGERILAERGFSVQVLPADLTIESEVTALFVDVAAQHGRVDGLLCSAGIGYPQKVLEIDSAAFDKVMAVNVRASFLCCQQAFRYMKNRGSGSLVLVASRLAQAAYPNMVPYVASKGAVVSMARALAVDMSPHGIRVNALAPGPTETPMLQQEIAQSNDPKGTRQWLENQTLLQGIAQPCDIAEAAGFLLSDASRFVTGSTLTVDGGNLARVFEGGH